MSRTNGRDRNASVIEPEPPEGVPEIPSEPTELAQTPDLATRTKQRGRHEIRQNRFVMIGGGALVTALLTFVAVSMPHRATNKSTPHRPSGKNLSQADSAETGSDKSLLPITDSGRPSPTEGHHGFLNERDLERTANRPAPRAAQATQAVGPGTLGSIAPFGEQNWQAPPYQPAAGGPTDPEKAEQEAMEKSSIAYIGKASAIPSGNVESMTHEGSELALRLGLTTGTRLRARLESAASSAARMPVVAVIEYNYERYGEIIVPAGAKAIGHIRDASRTGYVDIQFDTLLMPDGTSVQIAAAATGLDLRPLKGKVEGKNTGKNILVRSLSGIGQAGSMIIAQNSLNQPLNESDLIRERVSSNIGEAGDEEVSRLAISQRIVVTVPAGVPIYVVLEQTPRSNGQAGSGNGNSQPLSANIEQLQQLLRLQQELKDSQNVPSPR
jgi:hypothetical protein